MTMKQAFEIESFSMFILNFILSFSDIFYRWQSKICVPTAWY